MSLIRKAKTINEGTFWIGIISGTETMKFIVKLNTDQMRYDFINSEGTPLSQIGGSYSPFTVQEGNKAGKDNVDLYDTGQFHESFRVKNISKKSFDITSDPIVEDGSNLFDRWGEELEGLTFDSLNALGVYLLPLYQNKLLLKLGV